MSEYKENSTRRVLNKTNLSIQKQELYLVLEEHDLGDYILEEIIKIISEEDIPEGEDKNNYNPVLGLSIYRYDKTITKEIIKNDVKVKKIILNSICDELSQNLNFIQSTAYEIYNLIKQLNVNEIKYHIAKLKKS